MDGISVTLSSGAATTTSNGGYYQFSDVEGGIYTVTISGYPEDASFDATSAEVTIASSGQTVTRNFSGSYIRTASLMGMVTVEGQGLPGITVTISGRQNAEQVTDANGQYTFTLLRAGNYTVEIADFDPTDVAFSQASAAVAIAVGESKVWSFDGTYVRESTIMGQVSVEGNGLGDVTVSLQGMGADEEVMTDDGGQYTFDNLRAGQYSVAISGYDAREFGFETTSATVMVEHGKTANQPFEGIMLRTASIMGQVSVEGEGLADVTVSLQGEGENQTTETNDSGHYTFTDLPAGNFQVGISGYDTDDYSFETTSRNVSLALGATATVPFEGILLRTSGISGRVSVEGMDLDSVTVTLSGDDLEEDRTEMTDATGQYAFAGLAEGAYTVAISDFDDVSYNFETTSMDVELGDDDVQIVNFMGSHARTASVSGMLYVDEAGKNDAYNEGEDALAVAGIALALVGPGIGDVMPGITGPDGSFAFPGLRAGPYQLVVVPVNPLIPQDYAYGGPTEGYSFALGVGDEKMQNIPFDITHQNIDFKVELKQGDNTKNTALPGATVTLYSDAAGELKIADEDTGDDGMAAFRFPRSGRTAVYAMVEAPEGYHADGEMQAVMWDAKSPMHAASNDGDALNLMADFSFSGATVTTDFGGGEALGGWEISVTSGDDAVEGAPEELGADGSESFSETLAAGDIPKTYTIAMAGWKDQSNDTISGDGGERYTSTELTHTHDGLSLAGTSTNAGMLEVTYTTQTLRVYVHQENDQVMGYTGNVLGGDVRMGGIIDVEIAYIAANGRARSFSRAEGDTIRSSARGGIHTFRNVPADRDVIVTADEVPTLGDDADGNPIANTALLLDKNGHSDEIEAYTDVEANGITGGAFGAQGGFHHTVDLCPLMGDEANQRHNECSTFAFVATYAVDGQAWKWMRGKTSDDFASSNSKTGVKGFTVNMDPVAGENLASVEESFTAKAAGNLTFDFDRMPAGVYKVTTAPSSGWKAQRGPLESPTDDLAARLNPLDSALNIDVTPTTGYAYGAVTDGENRRLADVEVTVNGVTETTDAQGRYVVEGFGPQNGCGTSTAKNVICVTTDKEGSDKTADRRSFSANTPTRIDVRIRDATEVTWIEGKVTHSEGGAGVGGVLVMVDGRAPNNKNAKINRSKTNNAYKTLSDGSYRVQINAKPNGATAEVTVEKDGMFFSPDKHTVSALAKQTFEGINFIAFDNGTIHGRVVDGSNNPITGVIVTATQVSPGTATDADTTGTTGTYSLSVRYGQYDVSAAKHGYTFTEATGISVPNNGNAIDDLVGTPAEDNADLSSLSLSGVTLCRTTACPATARGFRTAVTDYTAEVGYSTAMTTVSATPSVPGARVTEIYPEDADDDESGHQVALDVGTTTIEVTVTAADGETTQTYEVAVTRLDEETTITGTVTDAQSGDGIAGVRITPSGGHLLNGGTNNYVTTNSDGEYTVRMESGSGSTTLRPSKPTGTKYTFEPGSRDVELNADEVSGIDFTGSAYGTITGTVVDAGGTEMAGVTVTATSQGISDTDTSDRRGRFSVTVPHGTATITAEVFGYTFASQSVALNAGESRSVGAITAEGTIQPTNVEAERDAGTDGAFDGNATVTWDAGGSPLASGSYQVQTCVPAATDDTNTADRDETMCDNDADNAANWTNFGSAVAFDATTLELAAEALSSVTGHEGGFYVRVQADDDDTGPNPAVNSGVISVDAIDATPSGAAATRDIDPSPDNLVVEWDGDRDGSTAARVIGSFDDGDTWVVLSTVSFTDAAYSATDGDGDHQWTFAFQGSGTGENLSTFASVAVVDGTTGVAIDADGDNTDDTETLTATMMDGIFLVRVQARQPGVDFEDADDDNTEDSGEETWKSTSNATVTAKN